MKGNLPEQDIQPILRELKALIQQSKAQIGRVVNSTITLTYWSVGQKLAEFHFEHGGSAYGNQVITKLSEQLTADFGSGWSVRHLFYCLKFSQVFPDKKILHTLCAVLSWSHLRLLIAIEDPLKRDFYLQMCQLELWSVRTLQQRIKSMLFERTAISKKPEQTIANELQALRDAEAFSPDLVFRDPYILDFLGLKDTYNERDLEGAILRELQAFITEFGSDFAFMARQKRIIIDNQDYFIDLLFFHRRLHRLVVVELKIGDFEAAYKGQMELYLRWLEKHMMVEGEELPIGLILCAGKSAEHVELMRLDQNNIRVAEYFTALPPRELLEAKLHEAIMRARESFGQRE